MDVVVGQYSLPCDVEGPLLCVGTPVQLIADCASGACEPDIAVLDIQMQSNGIDVARQIRALRPRCQVIFMTSYLNFATEVYDVEHAYFVLKSELNVRLGKAVDRAVERLGASVEQRIPVAFNGRIEMVPMESIRYMERIGHRTRICCASEEYITYTSPQKLLEGRAHSFVRCHSSYFVNAKFVCSMTKNEMLLFGDVTVPISRTFAASSRRALLEHAAAMAQ